MAGADQRTGSSRVKRLLARALIVAGAVAGGSVACVLGSGVAWADSQHSDSPSTVDSAVVDLPSPGQPAAGQPGPDQPPLLGKLTTLGAEVAGPVVPAKPGGLPGPAASALPAARHVLVPVERVAETTAPRPSLGAHDAGRLSPEQFHRALSDVQSPLWTVMGTALPNLQKDLAGIGAPGNLSGLGSPHALSTPLEQPNLPHEPSAARSTVPPLPAATVAGDLPGVPRTSGAGPDRSGQPGAPAVPHPEPFLPALPAGGAGCACTPDDHGSGGGLGIAWYATDTAPPVPGAGRAVRYSASSPVGGTNPQPGTTPD